MAFSGRTATTKAMGKGSTQFQHVMQTEVPPKLLEDWLEMWTTHHRLVAPLKIGLRPPTAGSEVLELTVLAPGGDDGRGEHPVRSDGGPPGQRILSVRDQNTFDPALRMKRLMTIDAPVADPPLQGGRRALREPDRGQPLPDRTR